MPSLLVSPMRNVENPKMMKEVWGQPHVKPVLLDTASTNRAYTTRLTVTEELLVLGHVLSGC